MTKDQDVFSTAIAYDVFKQKYSLNGVESWADMAKRVVSAVCGQLLSKEEQEELCKLVTERKFIPGGRYLYSAGKAFHQVNNCFLFGVGDSREQWAELMYKSTSALMSGGGIGVTYSDLRHEGALVKRTGGFSTGPIALMRMVNEAGRQIMQGGSRRSAIWAGLNWDHGDVYKFLALKNHSEELREMKRKNQNFPLDMELTNISVIYDTAFFMAIENEQHPKHQEALDVWNKNCLQAFSSAEPGFSFNFRKDNENKRNACQPAFAKITLANGNEITMEDLKVGDIVLNKNKKETQVIKKWSNGIKKVYAYSGNGFSFVGTEDHRVVALNHKKLLLDRTIEEVYNDQENILVLTLNGIQHVRDKAYIGDYEVFDITVEDSTHTYLTNGIFVHNCTEVTSEDDSDKCNLGTIWLNRIKDTKELKKIVKYATKFLICGGIYSDVPTEKIKEVGNKNNRIGLGLGGIHEWLITRGHEYEVVPELHKWLKVYEDESDAEAFVFSKELNVSVPKGVRSIAPTGTIGLLAETTTGVEPLFCKAYKRRYLKGNTWVYQYVVDGAVKRLMEKGVKLNKIKDAYDLSFKQRVKFQADVQNYVDMAISSTCNLPKWGSENNNEATLKEYSDTLLKYAKRLRGFTCYPDGARDGQPLERVELNEALDKEGTIFEDKEQECLGGVCGI